MKGFRSYRANIRVSGQAMTAIVLTASLCSCRYHATDAERELIVRERIPFEEAIIYYSEGVNHRLASRGNHPSRISSKEKLIDSFAFIRFSNSEPIDSRMIGAGLFKVVGSTCIRRSVDPPIYDYQVLLINQDMALWGNTVSLYRAGKLLVTGKMDMAASAKSSPMRFYEASSDSHAIKNIPSYFLEYEHNLNKLVWKVYPAGTPQPDFEGDSALIFRDETYVAQPGKTVKYVRCIAAELPKNPDELVTFRSNDTGPRTLCWSPTGRGNS